MYRYFTSLVKYIPEFFLIVSEGVINGILFFISVLVNSYLMCRNYVVFCMLTLHFAILLLVD